MGMAPLAIYLAQAGFTVTGEDDALTEAVAGLLTRERVLLGSIPSDSDLVVYSSAIGKAHPAYAAAVARTVSATCIRRMASHVALSEAFRN